MLNRKVDCGRQSVKRQGDKMTNEEIEKRINEEIKEIEKKLKEMSKLSEKERPARLIKIAIEYGVFNFPADGTPDTYTLFKNIHIYLQSKLMLNACASAKTSSDLAKQACNAAKWSCRWAAIAAIVACISIVVMLCLK